jgi:hypothetical protein
MPRLLGQGGVDWMSPGPVAYGWRRLYARIDGKFVAVGWGRPIDWEEGDRSLKRFRIQNNPGKEGKK